MLACVSTLGHADMCWYVPACADMCQHVPTWDINLDTSDSIHLDLIWKLACVSICGHADMCWHVPTCANRWHYSRHLWWRSFRLYLDAGMCQRLWPCRHVLICANMCRHVPACASMWNHSQHLWYQPFETYLACWHMSAHLNMSTCADMCWYVLTCADMCQHVPLISTSLIAII